MNFWYNGICVLTYCHLCSEWHLFGGELGEGVEDVGVEHASVEIDLIVPFLHAFVPPGINLLLVSLVVGCPEVLLVITSSEVVQVIIPLLEVWVCLWAHGHAELKEWQSLEHLVVCSIDLIGLVMVKDVHEHVIEVVMMGAATNDVVTLIYGTFFSTVEDTSGELSSAIVTQHRAIEPTGEVIFHLGLDCLVGLSEQVCEHLKFFNIFIIISKT